MWSNTSSAGKWSLEKTHNKRGRCCWAAPTAHSRGSHSASKLGKLLSSASFNLFSSRISPSSPSSHITYTCDFARKRRLQTISASSGLPCSALSLLVFLSCDYLLVPSLQAYHKTSFETQQVKRAMRNVDSGPFRPREGGSQGSPATTTFRLGC